jgi:hypothetical protein
MSYLTRAEIRQLPDHIEAFLGRELVGPFAACTRSAMPAREVAAQGHLPYGEDGTYVCVPRVAPRPAAGSGAPR